MAAEGSEGKGHPPFPTQELETTGPCLNKQKRNQPADPIFALALPACRLTSTLPAQPTSLVFLFLTQGRLLQGCGGEGTVVLTAWAPGWLYSISRLDE